MAKDDEMHDQEGNPIEGLYVDQNGDGLVNNLDLYRLEQRAPEYFMGLTSNITYKNISLSFAGRANVGNYVYYNIQADHAANARLLHPTGYFLNGLTDVQAVGFENQQYLSDHFVQNGSFFRLDHVTLSYRLDDLFSNKFGLGISATVQNPLLITKYDGIDPEINNGVDNNIYPRMRTFVFGLNASF